MFSFLKRFNNSAEEDAGSKLDEAETPTTPAPSSPSPSTTATRGRDENNTANNSNGRDTNEFTPPATPRVMDDGTGSVVVSSSTDPTPASAGPAPMVAFHPSLLPSPMALASVPARSTYIAHSLAYSKDHPSYASLAQALIDAGSSLASRLADGTSTTKRRGASKLAGVLSELTLYHVEYDPGSLFQPLLALLELDDPKIHRLTHYLLTQFDPAQVPSGDTLFFESLAKEAGYNVAPDGNSVSYNTIARRMAAISTLATLTPPPELRVNLAPVINDVLDRYSTIPKAPVKKKRTSFLWKANTQAAENTYMVHAALRAARARIPDSSYLSKDVVLALWSPDPVTARHAAALVARYAASAPSSVVDILSHLVTQDVEAAKGITPILPSPEMAAATAKGLVKPGEHPMEGTYGPAPLARAGGSIMASTVPPPIVAESTVEAVAEEKKKDKADKKAAKKDPKGHGGWPERPWSSGDALGRVYMVRALASICSKTPKSTETWESVAKAVLDPCLRVALEGVHCIARLGWTAISAGTLTVAEGPLSPGKALPWLDVALRRLRAELDVRLMSAESGALVPGTAPAVHALLRAIIELGRSWLSTRPAGSVTHPLSLMHDVIGRIGASTLANSASVRGKAIQAVLWTSGGEDVELLRALVAGELAGTTLPRSIMTELFLSLLQRVSSTGHMVLDTLELSFMWMTQDPGSVDENVVRAVWKHATKVSASARASVLDVAFRTLDMIPESPEKNGRIRTAIFWFLGENANFITGEYPGRYHILTPPPPQDGSSSLAPSPSVAISGDLSGLDLSATAVSGPGTIANKDIGMTSNPSMNAVVLRLQEAACTGSWEIRVTAVQALAKIALRAGDPLRLGLYEFLVVLTRDPAFGGLRGVLTPVFAALDVVYEAASAMARLPSSPAQASYEELSSLLAGHRQALALIGAHCYVPPNFLPLGPGSEPFLVEAARRVHD